MSELFNTGTVKSTPRCILRHSWMKLSLHLIASFNSFLSLSRGVDVELWGGTKSLFIATYFTA